MRTALPVTSENFQTAKFVVVFSLILVGMGNGGVRSKV